MKCDVGIVFHIEEILALQFVIFHTTSRIHAVCLNLDIQNACFGIRRWVGDRGVPLIEYSLEGDGSFYSEPNGAAFLRDLDNGDITGCLGFDPLGQEQ